MKWDDLVGRANRHLFKAPQTVREPRLVQRYKPCDILNENGVSNAVWFEDALAYYGSDTVVFDLYLLVADIQTATKLPVQAGYAEACEEATVPTFNDRSCRSGLQLKRPTNDTSGDDIFLLSNQVWRCSLPQQSAPKQIY